MITPLFSSTLVLQLSLINVLLTNRVIRDRGKQTDLEENKEKFNKDSLKYKSIIYIDMIASIPA